MEILYSRKSIYLFRSIQEVDKCLIIKPDYNSLRFVLLIILAIGFPITIGTRYNTYTYIDISEWLFDFYYFYSRTIVQYLFIAKFIGLCYILFERFRSINKYLTTLTRKRVI